MKRSGLRAAVLGFSLFAAALAGSRITAAVPRNAPGGGQASAAAQSQSPDHAAAGNRAGPIEAQARVTAYTLPPDLYRKRRHLGRIHFALNLIDAFLRNLGVLARAASWLRAEIPGLGRKSLRKIDWCRLRVYAGANLTGRGAAIPTGHLRTHHFNETTGYR